MSDETWTWRRGLVQAVVVTLVMLASLGLYLTVLWWRGPSASICTKTALDAPIPFWYGWVWVYLIPYALGPVAAALMRWQTFLWYLRRGISIVLITIVIFIVLPTRTAAHPVDQVSGDDPTSQLYRQMAEADGPAANAAPSLHVSLTGLLAVALVRDHRRWWWLWTLCVLLVWISTLFTWQHHVIDVVTGAALAGIAALPWRRVYLAPRHWRGAK